MKDDLIYRQAAIDALKNALISWSHMAEWRDAKLVKALIQVPSAQPDIIACGDCRHWICHDRRCGYWNHGVKPLDWCCHGERRTDE